jgi:hypothetical protein
MNDDAKIVEVIDNNYVVLHFYGMNIIYSVKDEKFNATRLVEAISDKEISEWTSSSEVNRLLNRFPNCLVVKDKHSKRLSGIYIDNELFPVVVCWANPSIGRFLTRGIDKDSGIALTKGYVYFMQGDGCDKFKIGCCKHLEPKLKGKRIISLVKVDNMFSALTEVITELKNELNDDNVYQPKGRIVNGDVLDVLCLFINCDQVSKGLKEI